MCILILDKDISHAVGAGPTSNDESVWYCSDFLKIMFFLFSTDQSFLNRAHVSPRYPSKNSPHTSQNLHITNNDIVRLLDCSRISRMYIREG